MKALCEDDTSGWVRYRDIIDVINEEAEGRNKANNLVWNLLQKMREEMMIDTSNDPHRELENYVC